MILFKNDFNKQPYYIQNTKNKSFIRMHFLLKKMGIKNNTFFLALTQPELDGIDIHSLKNPNPDLVARISKEVKINPWYYFREMVQIPSQGGEPISFMLNRANLALLWTFFAGISIYLVQPRQTGKTMSTQALVSWLMFVGARNYNMAMYTITNKLREQNVERLKNIKDALPPWFLKTDKLGDTINKQALSYAALTTKYTTYVAQKEVMAADIIGRGNSAAFTHVDESEYFDNLRTTYPAMYASITKSMNQAKEIGLPAGVIVTTTTGRLEEDACQYCMEIVERTMKFTEALYDSENKEQLYDLLDNNSTNRMIYAQFSYHQLGLTDEWLKTTIAGLNASRDQIMRDYLCIRTSGVDNSVIPVHLLEKIKQSLKDPVKVEIVNNRYVFNWYTKPEEILNNPNYAIIIGLDTSECIGKDFTSLVMMNASDMSVVCTARCNEADLIRLALYIAEFMVKNTNTLLIPERKSTASMMIGIICTELRKHGINPFTRIFNMIIQKRYEDNFKNIDISEPGLEEGIAKKYFGFTTTGSGETSRNALYSNTLMKAIELNHNRIYDSTLITELSSLAQKNGRIDHTTSGHDDTVIAYMLCAWFVFFGQNRNYYSINHKAFLNELGHNGDKVDKVKKEKQEAILQEIQNIKKELKRLNMSTLAAPLERQLHHLESLLDPDIIDTTPISTEQVIDAPHKGPARDFIKLAKLYFR